MSTPSSHSRNESHVELLATGVHDIRNDLQGILGCAALLLEEQEPGESCQSVELLKRIRRHALRAHLLMANYLDLSRLEAGLLSLNKQPLRLDQLLQQVKSHYALEAQRKQITLEYKSPQPSPILHGDAAALDRVFSNLLHNALKFTPAQGLP